MDLYVKITTSDTPATPEEIIEALDDEAGNQDIEVMGTDDEGDEIEFTVEIRGIAIVTSDDIKALAESEGLV